MTTPLRLKTRIPNYKTAKISLILKDLSTMKAEIKYTKLPKHIRWEGKIFLLNLDMGPVFYEEIEIVDLKDIEI